MTRLDSRCYITSMRGVADAELLTRWRSGDQHAGEELFDRLYPMVERFFVNKLTTEVDDLVQETFRLCVECRDRVAAPDKFRGFMMSIAYRVFCAHLRERYRAEGNSVDWTTLSIKSLSPSPSSLVAERRELRLLLEGLRTIPIEYQIILELHYWEDMTTADIGAVLDTPVGTIRSRLRRGRELLEEAMTRLAQSHDELRSTLSRLEDWARACSRESVMRSA